MQLNHYLNFQGNTEAAFRFYQSVFGGEFLTLMRYGDMPAQEGISLSAADQQKSCIFPCPLMNLQLLWPRM